MPKSEPLNVAIAGLYDAFAGYRLRANLPGCPCCICGASQRALYAEPLRELKPWQVEHFAEMALTTWGVSTDFRYFLPRLLELTAAGALEVDPAVVIGKLRFDRWEDWPATEREAVTGFLDAWWGDTLSAFPDSREVARVLMAIAAASDQVGTYLAAWQSAADPEPPSLVPVLERPLRLGAELNLAPTFAWADGQVPLAAVRHLAAFIDGSWVAVADQGRLAEPLWEPEPAAQVVRWLRSPAPSTTLHVALAVAQGQPWFGDLADAQEALDLLRGS